MNKIRMLSTGILDADPLDTDIQDDEQLKKALGRIADNTELGDIVYRDHTTGKVMVATLEVVLSEANPEYLKGLELYACPECPWAGSKDDLDATRCPACKCTNVGEV